MAEKISELVARELDPFLKEEGYELYHIEFVKESKDWYLRVFIERSPGENQQWPSEVGTEDCAAVSRYLSTRLDALDPIEQNYTLEVSSPGMDRPLLREEDYHRYKGSQVDVKLYKALDGKKTWTGTLLDYTGAGIVLGQGSGETIEIPRGMISKTQLTVVI